MIKCGGANVTVSDDCSPEDLVLCGKRHGVLGVYCVLIRARAGAADEDAAVALVDQVAGYGGVDPASFSRPRDSAKGVTGL